MGKKTDGTMPVLEHLSELRLRLVISAGALLVASGICFTYIEHIRAILTLPLEGQQLIFLSPPEAFMANLKLAIFSGLVLSLPVILHQVSAFIFPGLSRGEKKFYMAVLLGMLVLFSAGIIFAYQVVFPFTLRFFLQFADARLDPQFTITEYIQFVISFHLSFGVVFQLPLLTWALGKIGLLTTQFLRRYRKIALLVMLVVSAVITPPDIISQVVMILPLAFLYELGIIMVMISERKRLKAQEEQQ